MSSPVVVIFLGAPGSGKGTQSRLLSRVKAIPHISTGETLRDAMRVRTPLGVQVKAQMDSGNLVSDTLVFEIVMESLNGMDCESGFILDGFPRNSCQAMILSDLLVKLSFPGPLVVSLQAEESGLERRVIARQICPTCKEIYNTLGKSPKISSRCDSCQSVLEIRSDDNAKIFKVRLADFKRQTKPLVSYYRDRSCLIEISGDRNIQVVGQEVLAAYDQFEAA